MKKITKISAVLLLLLLITFGASARYVIQLSDVDFDASTGTITDYKNTTEKSIEIPSTLGGVAVTTIGRNAFYGNDLINSVTIPYGITTIEEGAFSNNKLVWITIPSTVTSIGKLAFFDNMLVEVTISSNLTQIGPGAFTKNVIERINGVADSGIFYKRNPDGTTDSTVIVSYGGDDKYYYQVPDGVTTIGDYAFYNHGLYSELILPFSVTNIGDHSFSLNEITSVSVPSGVTTIGESAFYSNKLTTAYIYYGVKAIGDDAFSDNEITSLNIPSSITNIGERAFSKNKLTAVDIPLGVDTIGRLAFYENEITSVTIPSSVTSITDGAFTNNKIVQVNGESSDGFIYGRNPDGTIDYKVIVSYGGVSDVMNFIPLRVTTIDDYAFYNCDLTSVTIPRSVNTIGYYAFAYNGVSSIDLPSDVIGYENEYWGEGFHNTRVTSITVFSGEYEVVGDEKYYQVKFLDYDDTLLKTETVGVGGPATAPSTPARVGYTHSGWDMDYSDITSDTTVTAQYVISTYNVSFIDHDNSLLKDEVVSHGSSATPPSNPIRTGYTFASWNIDYSNIISDTTITAQYKINKYKVVFNDHDGGLLKSDSVEYLSSAIAPANPIRDGYSFRSWDVDFSSITSEIIVTAQYYYILKLSDIEFDPATGTIVDYRRTSNKDIEIPSSFDGVTVVAIGERAFRFNSLTSVVIPSTVTSIGSSAFYECNLTTVTIPNSVTTIGNNAFFENSLTSVIFSSPARLTSIGESAFYDNELTTVTLPSSINYIGRSAFSLNNNIATIALSSDVIGYDNEHWENSNGSVVTSISPSNTGYSHSVVGNKESFQVTFVDYNGQQLKSDMVEYGTAAVAPANPVRPNHVFVSWDIDYSNILSDTTVTAQYEINKYKVVFNDHNGGLLKEDSVEHGSSAIAPSDPTRTGYAFTGWDKTFDNITADLTVTAEYIEVFTVDFVDHDNRVIKTEQVKLGAAATAPADPARTGYVFTGWDKTFNTITADLTVTAEYSELFTVNFVDHDNRVIKTEEVVDGGSATAPVDPNRTGYVFTGWDKTFNNITSDLTVIAEYSELFTVTFVDHDSRVIKTEEVVDGGSATAPSDPSRTGYVFTGWDKTFNNIITDLTVTAEYIEVFTVDFVDHDSRVIKTEQVTIGGSATAPSDPSRPGYVFTGWDKIFNNITTDLTVTAEYIEVFTVDFVDHDSRLIKTEQVEDGGSATAPSNPLRTGYTFTGWSVDFSNVTSSITVTAEYTINSYIVTFEDYNGDNLKVETVDYGSSATAPTVLERTGYTFTGWDKAFDNITTDLTVTAQYLELFTVSFIDHDNSVIKTEQVADGSSATAPADPTRTGYKFTGWDKTFDNISEDLTVTAQYEEVTSVGTESGNDFSVYPNPAVSVVTIEGGVGEVIEIYSQQGVLLNEIETVSGTQAISVAELPQGIYIIKVGDNAERLSIVR